MLPDDSTDWPSSLPGTVLNCALLNKPVTLVHPNVAGYENTAHVERAIRIALLES